MILIEKVENILLKKMDYVWMT